MYSKLISNFTEHSEYEFNVSINQKNNSLIEEFSDLENRLFPLRDCWEFIGFADGTYLASSQTKHMDTIIKMGSEYNMLINELLDDQLLRRMNVLLGVKYSQAHHLFSELEQLSIKAKELGEDYEIMVVPTWSIIIDSNSIFSGNDEPDEMFTLSKSFDNKYKRGFQTGLDEGTEVPFSELETLYHKNDFELPFSAEYVLLASEENY